MNLRAISKLLHVIIDLYIVLYCHYLSRHTVLHTFCQYCFYNHSFKIWTKQDKAKTCCLSVILCWNLWHYFITRIAAPPFSCVILLHAWRSWQHTRLPHGGRGFEHPQPVLISLIILCCTGKFQLILDRRAFWFGTFLNLPLGDCRTSIAYARFVPLYCKFVGTSSPH